LPYDGRVIESLNSVPVRLDIAEHRAEFLYWGFYEPRPWRNYLHTHSFFEVCHAYEGRGLFRTGDDEYVVDAGTTFLARPGDVHEIVSSTDDPLSIHFWSYTLVPTRRTRRGQKSASGGEDDQGRRLLESFGSVRTPVVVKQPSGIPGILELLAREAARPAAASSETIDRLAGVLLIETARCFAPTSALLPEPSLRTTNRDEQVARTMVQYLRDNFDRPVAVRDVAAQVHLSERHASRLFRTHTGTTIHDFLVRLRLEIAAQRLLERTAEGAPTITEVAHACGYPDVRHFTTAFRRHYGLTPGAFRNGGGTAYLR
jgi:AraC family L-rhamnose operon transcriptional activator RhaR